MLETNSKSAGLLLLATAAISYGVLIIRRLFFHPLANFPGPRLAAISGFYLTYYDLVMNGGLVDQLEILHKKYGPVVRIAPGKLHFNDPRAFDEIYCSKFTKEAWFYDAVNRTESSFGFIDPQKAKAREGALRPLFSRRAVLRLENVIQQCIDRFITVLVTYQTPTPRPLPLHRAYLSISMEVITAYCFDKSYHAIETPDFKHPLLLGVAESVFTIFLVQHFPFIGQLLFGMPHWLAKLLSPTAAAFLDVFSVLEGQIDEILANPMALEKAEHEIIYHHLLGNDKGKRPTKKSLNEEAGVLVGAGTDTVGTACMVGTFYLLKDENRKKRLIEELKSVWPELECPVQLEKLEKLPYLTGVIKESLRMSHGVVTPLPRVVPHDTVIADFVVPAETVVSMGATFMHNNSAVFPNPHKFQPERWLQPDTRELEENLVPFSRGPRSCLGVNLAWAELYLIFANVFRKVDMEIIDKEVEVLTFGGFFVPQFRGKVPEVYVKILEN